MIYARRAGYLLDRENLRGHDKHHRGRVRKHQNAVLIDRNIAGSACGGSGRKRNAVAHRNIIMNVLDLIRVAVLRERIGRSQIGNGAVVNAVRKIENRYFIDTESDRLIPQQQHGDATGVRRSIQGIDRPGDRRKPVGKQADRCARVERYDLFQNMGELIQREAAAVVRRAAAVDGRNPQIGF